MTNAQTIRKSLVMELLKSKAHHPASDLVSYAKELEAFIMAEEESSPLPNDLQPKPSFWEDFINGIKSGIAVEDEDIQNPYTSKGPSPFTMKYSASADPRNFVQPDIAPILESIFRGAERTGFIFTENPDE